MARCLIGMIHTIPVNLFMKEYIELNQKLKKLIPEEYVKGIHLSVLFALFHNQGTLNEMNAFRLVHDHPEMELNIQTILLLYDAMTKGTEREGDGFRKKNGYVDSKEFFFIPVPAEQTLEEMEKLCGRYAHLNHPSGEAFDDIFRFLLEFACIHPMEDGNGRLSAFLVEMLLRKAGLSMAPFLPMDIVVGKLHGQQYMRQVIRAAGSYYGQKPYEYDGFVRFARMVLEESYQVTIQACEKYIAM